MLSSIVAGDVQGRCLFAVASFMLALLALIGLKKFRSFQKPNRIARTFDAFDEGSDRPCLKIIESLQLFHFFAGVANSFTDSSYSVGWGAEALAKNFLKNLRILVIVSLFR